MLAVQCNINIFFIDWERPRARASTGARISSSSKNVAESSTDGKKSTGSTIKSTPDKINAEMAGVSIWRTYFAANEWAEIQSRRKTSLILQVFGVLFFLNVRYGNIVIFFYYWYQLLLQAHTLFKNSFPTFFSQHCIGGFYICSA